MNSISPYLMLCQSRSIILHGEAHLVALGSVFPKSSVGLVNLLELHLGLLGRGLQVRDDTCGAVLLLLDLAVGDEEIPLLDERVDVTGVRPWVIDLGLDGVDALAGNCWGGRCCRRCCAAAPPPVRSTPCASAILRFRCSRLEPHCPPGSLPNRATYCS